MSDLIRVDTPESVDVALETAGLGSRFLACLIDALVQWGVTFLLLMMFIIPTSITMYDTMDPIDLFRQDLVEGILFAILLLALSFLFFFYKLLLEAFWNGQTLGKRVAGIRVVKADGLPVDFLQVVIRNVMRVVDFLPMYYLIGSVTILASQRNQRLGDMVAGTVVVHDRKGQAPALPTQLGHVPNYDLAQLRESVLRLPEHDLEAARTFWTRRHQLEAGARYRVSIQVSQGLVSRLNWTGPLPPHPEMFIEAVLYVRAS
jgi:uncharacterized RDD family membrane protein YckC